MKLHEALEIASKENSLFFRPVTVGGEDAFCLVDGGKKTSLFRDLKSAPFMSYNTRELMGEWEIVTLEQLEQENLS